MESTVAGGRAKLGSRFWRLWWGTAISSSGDGLLAVALPLMAFTLTRNPLAIAGVTADQKAFTALGALPAGLVADRFERRGVMVGANVISGAALVGLVALMTAGFGDLLVLYLATAVLALCDVTYGVALQASVTDVVEVPSQLATANGRLMGVDGAGENFFGPAVGGFFFSAAQRLPFVGDAVSFFLSAVLVRASLPRRRRGLRHARSSDAGEGLPSASQPAERVEGELRHGGGWTADFAAGVRVFRRDNILKLLAATNGSVNFTQSMVVGVLVVYGERTLGLGSTGYGLFLAGAAVMGIVGSFLGGRIERSLGGAGAMVAGVLLITISYLGLSFTKVAVLAAIVLGLQEFGTAVANVGSVTTRQRITPRRLYGRVLSVHRFFMGIAAPTGAIVGGLIASASNVRLTLFVAGAAEAVALAYLAPALIQSTRQRVPGRSPN